MRKSCKVLVFLGKTPNPEFKRHQQQSMILCPMWNAEGTECYPGITPTRSMGVFGHAEDHAELKAPEHQAEVKAKQALTDSVVTSLHSGFPVVLYSM